MIYGSPEVQMRFGKWTVVRGGRDKDGSFEDWIGSYYRTYDEAEMAAAEWEKRQPSTLQSNRCWKGYRPVPGKIPYSKGSCRKIRRNPKPPQSVRRVACGALKDRKKHRRGGTAVGVARARDLCRGANVSSTTLKRMRSYFARHRASKNENAKRLSDRSSAASIADRLWGGSPGMRWASRFD